MLRIWVTQKPKIMENDRDQTFFWRLILETDGGTIWKSETDEDQITVAALLVLL